MKEVKEEREEEEEREGRGLERSQENKEGNCNQFGHWMKQFNLAFSGSMSKEKWGKMRVKRKGNNEPLGTCSIVSLGASAKTGKESISADFKDWI